MSTLGVKTFMSCSYVHEIRNHVHTVFMENRGPQDAGLSRKYIAYIYIYPCEYTFFSTLMANPEIRWTNPLGWIQLQLGQLDVARPVDSALYPTAKEWS